MDLSFISRYMDRLIKLTFVSLTYQIQIKHLIFNLSVIQIQKRKRL